MLSDLRESGSIEQDADLVMFIYRDEYYNGEESERQGLAEVRVAKHRNGPTETSQAQLRQALCEVLRPPRRVIANCLKCTRPFETIEVKVMHFTFPGSRYCEVCRQAEEVEQAESQAAARVHPHRRAARLPLLLVRELPARARHR